MFASCDESCAMTVETPAEPRSAASATLTAVPAPAVLPQCAAVFAVRFSPGADLRETPLPVGLDDARGSRRAEFLAGRHCASRALQGLGRAERTVARGPGGEPIWPHGITGSITHKGSLASAAAASRSDLLGLGIDTERIVALSQARRLSSVVLLPCEHDLGGALDDALRFTLIFSAKESVFKCLYPLVGHRFYYPDVAVTSVDVERGTFVAELTTTRTHAFPAGRSVNGGFEISGGYLHTGAWLPCGEPDLAR